MKIESLRQEIRAHMLHINELEQRMAYHQTQIDRINTEIWCIRYDSDPEDGEELEAV